MFLFLLLLLLLLQLLLCQSRRYYRSKLLLVFRKEGLDGLVICVRHYYSAGGTVLLLILQTVRMSCRRRELSQSAVLYMHTHTRARTRITPPVRMTSVFLFFSRYEAPCTIPIACGQTKQTEKSSAAWIQVSVAQSPRKSRLQRSPPKWSLYPPHLPQYSQGGGPHVYCHHVKYKILT